DLHRAGVGRQFERVARFLVLRVEGALFLGLDVRDRAELVAVEPPCAGDRHAERGFKLRVLGDELAVGRVGDVESPTPSIVMIMPWSAISFSVSAKAGMANAA